jgi:hypothetical protein
VNSGHYLAVKTSGAFGDSASMNLFLDPEDSEDAWFYVLPKYKVQSQGEKVFQKSHHAY